MSGQTGITLVYHEGEYFIGLDYLDATHAQRSKDVAELLTGNLRGYRLSDGSCRQLALGCCLHDIGKSDERLRGILEKGELTQDEIKMIKEKHTFEGLRIAHEMKLGSGIEKAALYHHERWDGKGYPFGLRGNEIPFAARAATLVDCLDSMVNPARFNGRLKGCTPEEAFGEIIDLSGTAFDPVLARSFTKMLKDPEKRSRLEDILVEYGTGNFDLLLSPGAAP